jgi:glucosamine 6-phosphate synthetase-like amidotransferase/phosphosugar isomerase protein
MSKKTDTLCHKNDTHIYENNINIISNKKDTLKSIQKENQVIPKNGTTENSTLSKTETVQLPPYVDKEIWDDWVQHRKEIKHPLKPTTIRSQLKQLEKWHNEGMDVNEIIQTSITNSYQGLFPLRRDKSTHQKRMSDVDAFFDKLKRKEASWINGEVIE